MTMKSTSKPTVNATTSEPLHVSSSLTEQSVAALLEKLFELAMKGNTTAAKLYIDHMTDTQPDTAQLSPEEAMKIVQDALKRRVR